MSKAKSSKPPWDRMKISRSTYFRQRRREREEGQHKLTRLMSSSPMMSVSGLEEYQIPLTDYERGKRDFEVTLRQEFATEREAAMRASALAIEAAVQHVLLVEFMHSVETHDEIVRPVWHLTSEMVKAIYRALKKVGYQHGMECHGRDVDLADAAVQ